MQRGLGWITIVAAAEVLRHMLESLGPQRRFLADDVSGIVWPEWYYRASQTTDAHLVRLAEESGLKLATLDAEIPLAFLLPATRV